jgi:hypothetical protein
MGLFQTMRQADLARKIVEAKKVVIYAAPGVTETVAEALLNTAQRIESENVIVILDVSAHTARMGYGRYEAVEKIAGAGINLRTEQGLRQGILIVDTSGIAFTLPAELVESDADEDKNAPNAIELTPAQVMVLRGELPLPKSEKALHRPDDPPPPVTIGATELSEPVMSQVKQELLTAPPQPFDLARQVLIYKALVRFVELEMKGWKLEGRRIELPKSLPVLATKDRDLKQRIKSSLHLLDKIKDGKLKSLRMEVEEIRKGFCVPVGGLGSVVLVQNQSVLEDKIEDVRKRLEEAKEEIIAEIKESLNRMVDGLVPELARAVINDPPLLFAGRYQKSQSGAEEFVRSELTRVFPNAEELVKNMSLRLTFKDVTYELLKEDIFKDKVLTNFSRSVLPGELLTEYDAACKRIDDKQLDLAVR